MGYLALTQLSAHTLIWMWFGHRNFVWDLIVFKYFYYCFSVLGLTLGLVHGRLAFCHQDTPQLFLILILRQSQNLDKLTNLRCNSDRSQVSCHILLGAIITVLPGYIVDFSLIIVLLRQGLR